MSDGRGERRWLGPMLVGLLVGAVIAVLLLCFVKSIRDLFPCLGCKPSLVALIEQNPCDSVPNANVAMPLEVIEALTGGASYENEIHDCQRLIVARQPSGESPAPIYEFGPLVGVFPLDTAMKLARPSDFAEARAVATIYNWGGFGYDDDPQAYDPLEIPDGWSCLWLQTTADALGNISWQSGVVPVDTSCIAATDTPTVWLPVVTANLTAHWEGDSLITLPDSARGVGVSPHVPETARWMWNRDTREHYIGIKCGSTWCSIGRSAMQAAPREMPDDWAALPGWYDEEHLAVDTGSGPVVPGPWAGYYPSRDLYSAARAPYAATALASLKEPAGMVVGIMRVYEHSAGLAYDPALRQTYIQAKQLDLPGAANSLFVWLRVLDDGVSAEYRRSRTTPGLEVPAQIYDATSHGAVGAVRWRWLDTDQKVWEACGDNTCCDTGF